MKILMDADAFPDIGEVLKISEKENIETILFCDNTHHLEYAYGTVVTCDAGFQSADIKLINQIEPFDIVLSQDYGVATIALAKGAYVLHPKGMIYTNETIDRMLFERHIHAKIRKHSHVKGPKKRTSKDQDNLLKHLEYLIQKSRREKEFEKDTNKKT